jgi:protein-tyrosine phosphatase
VFILIRLLRAFYIEPKNLQRGMRNMVSENKRRTRQGRFDLDLTYICPDVIAMSFPSTGRMAWYRNSIRDVAAYLDERHGVARYRVYNLCSEREYETRHFHGQVARYEIDDHNVPTLCSMLAFCRDAQQFLAESPDNVVVVHCKGTPRSIPFFFTNPL